MRIFRNKGFSNFYVFCFIFSYYCFHNIYEWTILSLNSHLNFNGVFFIPIYFLNSNFIASELLKAPKLHFLIPLSPCPIPLHTKAKFLHNCINHSIGNRTAKVYLYLSHHPIPIFFHVLASM